MKLSDFKKTLAERPDCVIRFILPTGTKIPAHAHVTEVARIDKRFMDCGGVSHAESVCRLQTWFADDTDHRLTAGTLLSVLEKSSSLLETDNLDVDVEHEAPFISQFPVETVKAGNQELLIHLGIKHTACLAEDRCLPPKKFSVLERLPDIKQNKCC